MADQPKGLPANAYKPLNEGERYEPFIPAGQAIPEITMRSVLTGAIMAALFTFATAYSGLKAGQVFEAAIPIAILAVGLGKLFARKNTILENVIIQSIGAASGAVVAGAIFTLPALFMLNLNPKYLTIFFAAFLGGVIGVLFLIPLRRYFVADQHGLLPFPEATASFPPQEATQSPSIGGRPGWSAPWSSGCCVAPPGWWRPGSTRTWRTRWTAAWRCWRRSGGWWPCSPRPSSRGRTRRTCRSPR